MALRVPAQFVEATCALYEKNGTASHRAELLNESDFDSVALYQQEYRGYVEYYSLAQNLHWLAKLRWVMETALLKTLASKPKSSVTEAAQRYRAVRQTPHGPRKCLQVMVERQGKPPLVACFGGLSLTRRSKAVIKDPVILSHIPQRTELIKRRLAEECEACGVKEQVEVHHVRKLADLKQQGRREPPLWVTVMAARKRKTLALCRACHRDLHAGRPLAFARGTS